MAILNITDEAVFIANNFTDKRNWKWIQISFKPRGSSNSGTRPFGDPKKICGLQESVNKLFIQ